jgi:hypothetical protein
MPTVARQPEIEVRVARTFETVSRHTSRPCIGDTRMEIVDPSRDRVGPAGIQRESHADVDIRARAERSEHVQPVPLIEVGQGV